MKKYNSKLAFSLIEISVVILIIGILVIGITKGTRIIRASKLRTAQSLTNSSPVASMDGILFWVEATLDKSFTASEIVDTPYGTNGTISIWNDINPQTTTPNSPTQGSANDKPRYKINAINSLPALNFDGSSEYLNFNGSKLVNSNYSIFVVEQRRSSNLQFFISGTDNGDNLRLSLGYRDTSNATFAQYGNDYDATVSAYSSPFPRIHSYRFSSTKGKNYNINGTDSAMFPSPCCSPPVATQGLISFNGAMIAGGNFYNGDIGEIIIFNRYITDSERSFIEKYLKAKWGIK